MISNKNIVVTGASSGIGKSILSELVAQEGNRIIAAARGADRITGYGDNVIPFSCDLSTKEGVDALFAKAEEVFDKIDIFFCNAAKLGISILYRLIQNLNRALFKRAFYSFNYFIHTET